MDFGLSMWLFRFHEPRRSRLETSDRCVVIRNDCEGKHPVMDGVLSVLISFLESSLCDWKDNRKRRSRQTTKRSK